MASSTILTSSDPVTSIQFPSTASATLHGQAGIRIFNSWVPEKCNNELNSVSRRSLGLIRKWGQSSMEIEICKFAVNAG